MDTIPKNFRIDGPTWLEFVDQAHRRNKQPSGVIRALVERQVFAWRKQPRPRSRKRRD